MDVDEPSVVIGEGRMQEPSAPEISGAGAGDTDGDTELDNNDNSHSESESESESETEDDDTATGGHDSDWTISEGQRRWFQPAVVAAFMARDASAQGTGRLVTSLLLSGNSLQVSDLLSLPYCLRRSESEDFDGVTLEWFSSRHVQQWKKDVFPNFGDAARCLNPLLQTLEGRSPEVVAQYAVTLVAGMLYPTACKLSTKRNTALMYVLGLGDGQVWALFLVHAAWVLGVPLGCVAGQVVDAMVNHASRDATLRPNAALRAHTVHVVSGFLRLYVPRVLEFVKRPTWWVADDVWSCLSTSRKREIISSWSAVAREALDASALSG